MTVLNSFECSNCGAKVDRPEPGQTTVCPFCNTELEAPKAPPPVVVREIVRERVVERPAPVPEFRAPSRQRLPPVVILIPAAVAIGLWVLISSNAEHEKARLDAAFRVKRACEQRCEEECKVRFPKPTAPAPTGSSGAGVPIGELMGQTQTPVDSHEVDRITCGHDCKEHCH